MPGVNLKILIVEDQFLEANELGLILRKAGHMVLGVGKSVEQAKSLIIKNRPDIVLIDIFLKGDLTGIDLAKDLNQKNIPFIYLSANSNAATLESAIATKPYGFLIKPFRDREILIALDIAIYRHQKNCEFITRQHHWLASLLKEVLTLEENKTTKIQSFIKTLTSFLPFDFIIINTDLKSSTGNGIYGLERIGFDEYQHFDFLNVEEKIKDFRSKLQVPLRPNKDLEMSIVFYSRTAEAYTAEHSELMVSVREELIGVIEMIRKTRTGPQIITKSQKTESPNQLLKPQIDGIVGNSPKLLEALDKISQIVSFDNTVLILGETGVGKEGLANVIHRSSNRKLKPLIKVNCAAIPVNLVESELFGHEKGSFTGALEKRIGKFEQANGGTLFLDEVGELPFEIQSKLLRAIQEKEIERVGGRTVIKTDIRIISATNRDLLKEIAEGRFRLDLYYRLNVFPIILPPLRERKEDILTLANYFLKKYCDEFRREKMTMTSTSTQQLLNYNWPGNIRELQYLIERHVLQTKENIIKSFEMPDPFPSGMSFQGVDSELKSFDEMDRVHIRSALKKSKGKISGEGGAADLLKLQSTTLRSKMKRLGITWPNK
jgi:DNA-binding NtrC family response regulator